MAACAGGLMPRCRWWSWSVAVGGADGRGASCPCQQAAGTSPGEARGQPLLPRQPGHPEVRSTFPAHPQSEGLMGRPGVVAEGESGTVVIGLARQPRRGSLGHARPNGTRRCSPPATIRRPPGHAGRNCAWEQPRPTLSITYPSRLRPGPRGRDGCAPDRRASAARRSYPTPHQPITVTSMSPQRHPPQPTADLPTTQRAGHGRHRPQRPGRSRRWPTGRTGDAAPGPHPSPACLRCGLAV
jgi:hypothetical protein